MHVCALSSWFSLYLVYLIILLFCNLVECGIVSVFKHWSVCLMRCYVSNHQVLDSASIRYCSDRMTECLSVASSGCMTDTRFLCHWGFCCVVVIPTFDVVCYQLHMVVFDRVCVQCMSVFGSTVLISISVVVFFFLFSNRCWFECEYAYSRHRGRCRVSYCCFCYLVVGAPLSFPSLVCESSCLLFSLTLCAAKAAARLPFSAVLIRVDSCLHTKKNSTATKHKKPKRSRGYFI